jgi:hypothetical protein
VLHEFPNVVVDLGWVVAGAFGLMTVPGVVVEPFVVQDGDG